MGFQFFVCLNFFFEIYLLLILCVRVFCLHVCLVQKVHEVPEETIRGCVILLELEL